MQLYVVGAAGSVLNQEVSLFKVSFMERFLLFRVFLIKVSLSKW